MRNPIEWDTAKAVAGILLGAIGTTVVVGAVASAAQGGGSTGSTGAAGATGATGTTGPSDGGYSGGGGGGPVLGTHVTPMADVWAHATIDSTGEQVEQAGGHYRMSSAPAAGTTLAAVIQVFQTSGFTVVGWWDAGQTPPADWPVDDQGSNRWRIEVITPSTLHTNSINVSQSLMYAPAQVPQSTILAAGGDLSWIHLPADSSGNQTADAGKVYRLSAPASSGVPAWKGASTLQSKWGATVLGYWENGAVMPKDWPAEDSYGAGRWRYEAVFPASQSVAQSDADVYGLASWSPVDVTPGTATSSATLAVDPGQRYLVSFPGHALIAPMLSAGMKVVGQWNGGSGIPAFWPGSDQDPSRDRYEMVFTGASPTSVDVGANATAFEAQYV